MKDFNSIFIGAMTKQYARDSDIGTSQNPWKKLVIFSLNVQSIYKQTSIPVLKNVIKSAISLTAWKTPSYVRRIACIDAKVFFCT